VHGRRALANRDTPNPPVREFADPGNVEPIHPLWLNKELK
jgi:hypothetical protein